jgi:hypothetical protein
MELIRIGSISPPCKFLLAHLNRSQKIRVSHHGSLGFLPRERVPRNRARIKFGPERERQPPRQHIRDRSISNPPLAKDKMQGAIVGRKKIFGGFAEKKEDRQTRLKVLFANMEKMAEEMKNRLAIKEELRSEGKRDVRDNTISRRGVFCGNQDGPTGSPLRPTPRPLSPLF